MAGLANEFTKCNCKISGISGDPVSSHHERKQDIVDVTGNVVDYPLIGDPELKVAKLCDMLPADEGESS